MAERSLIDQLDDAVTAIIARRDADLAAVDTEIASLAQVARELRGLPGESFKASLRTELTRRETMSTPRMKVDPIPKGFPTVSPYLCFSDAPAAIEFYKKAFNAEEQMRLAEPSGKIGHAELKIGNAIIMLSDEYPDYGAVSPQTLGGSPVRMHLYVEDVDAFVRQAVAAGARIVRPIEDQFYGDRSGQIADPFGYTWNVATQKEKVSLEEMQKRMNALTQPQPSEEAPQDDAPKQSSPTYKRKGFHAVTPYLTVQKAPELVEFLKQAFGATELFRTTGSAGGLHCELQIRESMIIVGGHPGVKEMPTSIHLYIPDVDAVYERALKAGATPLFPPADQPYGERSGAVVDASGNQWYLATPFETTDWPEELRTVTIYFHPIGAPKMIEFLKNAFGGDKELVHQSDEGYVYHAKVRLGDSMVEMGEARGPSQPMPTAIYLYVENVDEIYDRALKAGATSVLPPTDQDYGDRNAWVNDPFGNVWYIATKIGA